MVKNTKIASAALLVAAAFAMASCGTVKKVLHKSPKASKTNSIARVDMRSNSAAEKSGNPAVDMSENSDVDNSFLVLSDAQRAIVNKNNAFAFQLFDKVSGHSSQVVSPMSVVYLMGMLANGADGQTQQEILKAIGCEGIALKSLNETYKAILATSGKLDRKTTVEIANYIAVNKKYEIKKDFASLVSADYQAAIERLNFASPSSLGTINGWCSGKTHGMIPQIIDQMDPSAVSYWMNAIYFNGTWQKKFDAKYTKQENFRGYTRDIQKVDMMHQISKFFYAENDVFKTLELPYGNGAYRMMVFLPNEGKTIKDMRKQLDAEKLSKLSDEMEQCMVNLKLPKFTTEQDLPLNQIISDLGAPSIFQSGKADFSQFSKGNFFVSKMLQKAKIEVSEQGTKAAAVTAAVMLTSAAPIEMRNVDFHADHPFMYIIQDTQSGAILFMGQYTGRH